MSSSIVKGGYYFNGQKTWDYNVMKPKNKELNEAHILHENMKWNCKKLQKSSSQDVQEAMKYFGGEAEMKWEGKAPLDGSKHILSSIHANYLHGWFISIGNLKKEKHTCNIRIFM